MNREKLLKDYILSRYKSIRDFCLKTGFSYSTIDYVLKNDIMKSSISVVLSICDHLNIDLESLINGEIKEKKPVLHVISDKEQAIIIEYRKRTDMQSAVDRLLGIEE